MTMDSSDDEEWFDPVDSWEGENLLETGDTGKHDAAAAGQSCLSEHLSSDVAGRRSNPDSYVERTETN